jgi:hypothetical protein
LISIARDLAEGHFRHGDIHASTNGSPASPPEICAISRAATEQQPAQL